MSSMQMMVLKDFNLAQRLREGLGLNWVQFSEAGDGSDFPGLLQWVNLGVSENGGSPKPWVSILKWWFHFGWFVGTPILGNFHLGVSEKPVTTHQMAEEGKLWQIMLQKFPPHSKRTAIEWLGWEWRARLTACREARILHDWKRTVWEDMPWRSAFEWCLYRLRNLVLLEIV